MEKVSIRIMCKGLATKYFHLRYRSVFYLYMYVILFIKPKFNSNKNCLCGLEINKTFICKKSDIQILRHRRKKFKLKKLLRASRAPKSKLNHKKDLSKAQHEHYPM